MKDKILIDILAGKYPAKVGHGKSFYLKMRLYQLQQRKRGRKDIEPKQ